MNRCLLLIVVWAGVLRMAAAVAAEAVSPANSAQTSADQARAERVVADFFAAYAAKDLTRAFSCWTEDSPDRVQWRTDLAGIFAVTGDIQVKRLKVGPIRREGDRSRVRVSVELSGLDQQTGRPADRLGPLDRDFELARSGEGFLIVRVNLRDADPDFRERLFAARNPREIQRVVEAESDDPVARLALLAEAFVIHASDEQRQRLLQNEPFGFLAKFSFVISLNGKSWTRFRAAQAGKPDQLERADLFNHVAMEVAEFIDSPEAQAWCRVLRALIWQRQGRIDEALGAAHAAVDAFERLGLIDGQAAAQTVLGRLLTAQGNKRDAAAAFDAAERLFAGVVILPHSFAQTLGEQWAVELGELSRLDDALNAARTREDWDSAHQQWLQAMAIERELYGPWHRSLVGSELARNVVETCRGNFEAALDAAKSGLDIARRVYEDGSPEIRECELAVATAQQVFSSADAQRQAFALSRRIGARAYARQLEQKFAESLKLWDEVIRLRTSVLGEAHVVVGETWLARAKTCRAADDVPGALASFRRAAQVYAAAGLTDLSDYLDALNEMAALLTPRALDTMTDADLQSAVAAMDALATASLKAGRPEDDATVVAARTAAAAYRRILDLSADGRAAVQRAWRETRRVSLRGASSGDRSEELLDDIEILDRSLTTLEPLFGEAECARLREEMAIRYRLVGQLEPALDQLLRARQALERAGQAQSLESVRIENELGMVYQDRNELRQASDAIRAALSAVTRMKRFDSTEYLTALRASIELQQKLGGYPAAERDTLRILLFLKRRLLPVGHSDYYGPAIPWNLDAGLLRGSRDAILYVSGINELGVIQLAAGEYAKSRDSFQAAFDLAEKLDEDERRRHDTDLRLLSNLGVAWYNLGDGARAEVFLRRALELQQSRHGHADASRTYNLANILQLEGKREEALKYYRQAQSILPTDPRLRNWPYFWGHLGVCQAALHDRRGAIESFETALQLFDRRLDDIASFNSEQVALRAWNDFAFPFWSLCTLTLNPEASADEVTQTWNWSLRIKGRSLDTRLRYRQLQRQLQRDPAVARLVARSSALRNEISDLAVNPPAGLATPAIEARIERLNTELDDVVGELNRATSRSLLTRSEVRLTALRKKLPPDAALVEFARISLYDWTGFGRAGTWSPHRYVAFVLPGGADAIPALVDLGDVEPIDGKISEVRELIATTPQQLQDSSEQSAEAEFQEQSRELYRLVFAPVAARLGTPRTLYVLPDSELQRIAFESLVDRPGHYLIEDYQFAYLSSAGDLLRPLDQPGQGTWVFAGPDYDLPTKTQSTAHDDPTPPRERGDVELNHQRLSPEIGELVERGGKWKPLPHATEELQVVGQSLQKGEFGPVHAFTGRQATEEVLKTIHSPRILHLATHGFFLKDAQVEESEAGGIIEGRSGAGLGMGRLARQQNPYLRSGFVLAGANRLGKDTAVQTAHSEDGWVTAEEIASLDLHGTELVVLSACETGLGDVKTGAGVEGLRQAFLYAGARALVTTLYRVPDESTRQLMEELYAGLKERRGTLRSLHDAQLHLLQQRRAKHGAAHPYFWGSFVLVGNPQ